MNVLITGVGGPTPRSFAIALKQYGNYGAYRFVGTDTRPLAIGLYQRDLFSACYVVPAARDTEAYWQRIDSIVASEKIDLAVILPEQEVVVWAERQARRPLPCPSLIPDHALSKLLVDKARMTEAMASLGLVPPSVRFHRDEAAWGSLRDALGVPFWVRSAVGSSGLGSLKISDEDMLASWVMMNPGVEVFLGSRFLAGRNLACKLLYFNGNLVRAACAERVHYVMAKVAPSGITGNTSFGRLVNEPDIVAVCDRAMSHMFESCGVMPHGFFTVDLKEDRDGRPFITEVNIRHVAFTQCFAAGGANLAEDTIRLLDGDTTFDPAYHMYAFEPGTIFLRDVDSLPIVMQEHDVLA